MVLIDTHAHLDDGRFDGDIAEVVARAAEAGLSHIITVATDGASCRAAIALAERFPMLRVGVGLHPNYVAEAPATDWDIVLELAGHPSVVAIGETGLDRHWDKTPFPQQEESFARHLELAHRLDKPIVIHAREAEEDVARMIKQAFDARGPVKGVLHSYTGPIGPALEGVQAGLHVSFAGMLTYKTADNVREVAKQIPLDRLLVETDAPYLAPVPHRGRRNEPAHVIHTAKQLADVRGIPWIEMAAITTANAKRLFSLS
ncbi:TatD family hydrolase [Zavarzinella formosa]|uniref:TatD family hydrolase n=1 Tax=Zavarzinella formosa TaxID=360055 RepID=UPI0002DB730F|nr:TatD family hydrolase [Zavarzinella formosa]